MLKSLTRAGMVLCLAAGGVLGATAGAEAAPAWQCKSYTNGKVCIAYDTAGYNAQYYKSGGNSTIYVDFNLVCDNGRVFGDNGAFPIAPGETKSYVFKVRSQGRCHVRLKDMQTGSYFNSPSITR